MRANRQICWLAARRNRRDTALPCGRRHPPFQRQYPLARHRHGRFLKRAPLHARTRRAQGSAEEDLQHHPQRRTGHCRPQGIPLPRRTPDRPPAPRHGMRHHRFSRLDPDSQTLVRLRLHRFQSTSAHNALFGFPDCTRENRPAPLK